MAGARTYASDLGWTEGPLFRNDGGEIVVVSIDRGHVYAVTEGAKRLIAVCGGGPNGATEGADGSIYVTQNGGRKRLNTPGVTGSIQVIRPSSVLECLTSDPIAPNDLCFGPDGFLYVTDPTRNDLRNDGRLWRVDVENGAAELLVSVHWYPNGIGFGLEDDGLYVADSGGGRIMRFPLSDAGLGEPEVAVDMEHGRPDGFCFDTEGNIVIAAIGDGGRAGDIQTWDREGALVDVFNPGPNAKYTNVALDAGRRLVITDSEGGSVLMVDEWPAAGLPLHPFR